MEFIKKLLIKWAINILNKYQPDTVTKTRYEFHTIDDVVNFYLTFKKESDEQKQKYDDQLHNIQMSLEQTKKVFERDYQNKEITDVLIKDYSTMLNDIDKIRKGTGRWDTQGGEVELKSKYLNADDSKIPKDGGLESIVETLETIKVDSPVKEILKKQIEQDKSIQETIEADRIELAKKLEVRPGDTKPKRTKKDPDLEPVKKVVPVKKVKPVKKTKKS